MRTPLAATLVAALAAGAAPSDAAMRPANHVVDPKGDAKGNLGFADVVTGVWRTSGRGQARALVATLELAAPPRADRGFVYDMRAQAEGCGTVTFRFAPGTAAERNLGPKSLYLACGSPEEVTGSTSFHSEVGVHVSGRTITWSIPLAVLPRQLRVGTSLTEFEAIADVGEPLTGYPAGSIPDQSIDMGFGYGRWVVR